MDASASAASRGETLALLGAATAFVIFAGHFVMARHAYAGGFIGADLAALRYAVPGLVFLPLIWRWGWRDLAGIGWSRAMVLTLLSGSPYGAAFLTGLQFAPTAHGAVINPGLTLVSGALLGWLWLGESFTWGRAAGAMAAVVGLGLVGWHGLSSIGEQVWIGDCIFFVTGLAWGYYTALLRRWSIDPLRGLAVVSVLSLVLLPPYLAWRGTELWALPGTALLAQGAYHGLLHALLAMLLYMRSVSIAGAARTTAMTPLVPTLATLLAIPFLGEWPDALQWAGVAAVSLGMVLTTLRA
ncbi:MAG: DMT family transporter [Alphaproteobacteria bacterium]|nr:DMT family transporter [Alphaproteobacteria bacterium]